MPFSLRDSRGREYLIRSVVRLGREPSNEILIKDPLASRHHATIWEHQGILYIRDEKSRNGTTVNDARIQQIALRPGDRITIGSTTLTVGSTGASSRSQQAPAYQPPTSKPPNYIPPSYSPPANQPPSYPPPSYQAPANQPPTWPAPSYPPPYYQPPSYPPPAFQGPSNPPPPAAAPKKRSTFFWIGFIVVFLMALAAIAGGIVLFSHGMPDLAGKIPGIGTQPTPPLSTPIAATTPIRDLTATGTISPTAYTVAIVATSEPQKMLQPEEFADANAAFVQSIADLNRAELKFIEDAKTTTKKESPHLASLFYLPVLSNDLLNVDLIRIAAQAMTVAQNAEDLARFMAGQDLEGDAAQQSAEQYGSIARLGYALVIEAQNLRDGLQTNIITPDDAVDVIAEYGARLWNPKVTDPAFQGNPFLPDIKDAATQEPVQFLGSDAAAQFLTGLGGDKQIQSWLVTSQETITKTIDLPAPTSGVSNLFDPSLNETMTTTEGQSDAELARQVASAKLAQLTSNPIPTGAAQMQFSIFKNASIADSGQIEAGNIPSFSKGKGCLFSKQAENGAQGLVNDLFELEGQTAPKITSSSPLKTFTDLTLQISGFQLENIKKINDTEVDLEGQVSVQWIAIVEGLSNPQIAIKCRGSTVNVYGKIGQAQIKGSAGVWNFDPDHAILPCTATFVTQRDSTLRPPDASAVVLINWKVGEALTLETDTPEPAQNANSSKPDTSWIDPHVQAKSDQMLLDPLNNPLQVAIVIEDYRICLIDQVMKGADQEQAISRCSFILAGIVSAPESPAEPPATDTPEAKPPNAPLTGRILFDFDQTQSSRSVGGELKEVTLLCIPDVIVSPDGVISGECEYSGSTPVRTYSTIKATVSGTSVQGGSFSFTYAVTEKWPNGWGDTPGTPSANVWSTESYKDILYTGSGSLTSATEASGTADWEYSCDSGADNLYWCGSLTNEYLKGTITWWFGPAE